MPALTKIMLGHQSYITAACTQQQCME